jgi:putative ABC transport system permease protein
MTDLKLILSYLRARLLMTSLTVISVALGLALATIVLIISNQTQKTLNTETANWDIVVGAKGSPLQIVLNSLYYLDAPAGNINISVWKRLQSDPVVERVIPLTMGDNYFGSPIIGTVPEFFDGRKSIHSGEDLFDEGKNFTKPFEIVAGAEVAGNNHLKIGQKIVGAHGWTKSDDFHHDFPYTVVGILSPTGTNIDRAVYTDYHSTWVAHAHGHHHDDDEHKAGEIEKETGHHDEHDAVETAHDAGHHEHEYNAEVTSLLVRLHQPGARFRLVQDINANHIAQAVIPVDEIDKVARTFIAPLQGILLLVAYLVVFVSTLTILISLYYSIHQRRRDIAVIRSLGATRADVFRVIALEAAVLSGLGVIFGWLLGHGLTAMGASTIMTHFGIALNAWHFDSVEGIVALSVLLLGIFAGLLPAIIAYRLSVADILIQE